MNAKQRLKICLVNHEFFPNRSSGQAVYAEKIARGLAFDHDITVVTARPDGTKETEHFENIRIIRIPTPRYDSSQWIAFGSRAGKFVSQLALKEHFDVVHFLDAHVGYACRIPFVATLHQSFNQRLTGNKGLPYHSTFFNLIKRYPYYIVAKELEKKALKKATAFISVSRATKDEFVQNYNVDPSKIEVVYNGIDTDFFKPVSIDTIKRKLGLGDEKILLYVGFTTPRKGVETLAQALAILKHNKIKLIMVGTWEKGYRKKFFTHLDSQNRKRIIETGYVEENEMPAYYSLADIFVLPSLLEGFGFPLAEAMACSTPVISTRVGAIPEVVGDCGIIIPPQEPNSLADAIQRLLDDQDLTAKLKSRARKQVCENFSETVMLDRTMRFYRNVVGFK